MYKSEHWEPLREPKGWIKGTSILFSKPRYERSYCSTVAIPALVTVTDIDFVLPSVGSTSAPLEEGRIVRGVGIVPLQRSAITSSGHRGLSL